MIDPVKVAQLESELNNFDPERRSAALAELASLAKQSQVLVNPVSDVANMHSHTFFSYNAYGYSPSSLAWQAKRHGIKLMGIVDFDVLDGVDEFLAACDLLGVCGSAGMETRTFIPQFASREINSPGEPGVYYHMGIGFTTSQVPDRAKSIQNDLRNRALQRNLSMVQRVNAFLSPVAIDYEKDVLPLTPSGTATERHIVLAYMQAVESTMDDSVGFWAAKLSLPSSQITDDIQDSPKFQNLIRSKLMKRGGVGYIEPGPDSFPSIEEVDQLILACDALPCATWLDGISPGEQAIEELLDLLVRQGVVALNIIPDRNWRIPDPEQKAVKLNNLYHVVRLAEELCLPLNIGTEMNSYGQKIVDDFNAPEMVPVRQAFLDGAHFIYGHTALQRSLKLGYLSPWAQSRLPSRRERSHFYTRVGYHIPAGTTGLDLLKTIGQDPSPEDILFALTKMKREDTNVR